MQESSYPACRVWAYAAWVVTFTLVTLAWAAMFEQPANWHLAGLLAFTAAISSAVAAVLHVRSFMVRIAALVRAANGMDPPAVNDGLHSIR